MIKVTGRNRKAVITRFHHQDKLGPYRDAFLLGLLFRSSLASDDNVHILHQSRNGVGSWGLYLSDGRQFHFRSWGDYDFVIVHDSYNNVQRKVVARFTDPVDMAAWVASLSVGQLKAA